MNLCKGCIISLLLFCSLSVLSQNKDTVVYHSPSKAILLSAFCPGAGQIYNRQIWKVPVIYAGLGASVYFAIYNNSNANKFKKEYQLRNNGITEGRRAEYANYPDESIYNLYYAYEKNFELSIIAASAVYILNLIDALVYAHLFSYDISDNLSMQLVPYALPNVSFGKAATNIGISMSLRF